MRILVAEDHPTLARSLVEGLRDEGYSVDLAFDGVEALHAARSVEYDCVLLDVMLPRMEGWDILKNMRSDGNDSPVLMLTARDALDDRVRGLDLGADDYLVKPFEWEELIARVRALIRRTHDRTSPLLSVADLQIDTAGRSVTRADQPIDLTAKEYALLEYLAHRSGQVVTRGDIWDHLYDQHDEIRSNVIDVLIGNLRRKIDRGHDQPLIQTRRGQGYLLGDGTC